jgi:hypothetical protein
VAFHAANAGASVGARTARKEKVSNFKTNDGTTVIFGPERPLP